jgi:hypothetical protein
VAVAWGASAAGKSADVFVAVSRDGGRTFGAPVQVNTVPGEARLGGELPPRVALSPSGSADPEIAVLWTARGKITELKMARSRDGGRTFDRPIALQSRGAPGDRGWAALALDADAVAHAIWVDHRGLAGEGGGHAHHGAGATDGVAMAQKSSVYYAATKPASASERELTRGVCYCCKTAMAIGPDGTIYAAWRHVYPGNLRDIAVSVSRDGGRSFAAPARVSRDGWEITGCPDDGPAMAVDATGLVHLIWPTVIGSRDAPEGALFYATTRDGRVFSPRVRVPTLGSLKPSHPQIAVDDGGRVVVAWDELMGGKRVAAVRQIRRGPDGHAFGGHVVLAPDSSAMYPVLASTSDGWIAVWTNGLGESSVIGVRPVALPR